MPKENNKMQVDIENLTKQNVNDLTSIKELYRKLKEVEEKITQIKYIDSNLANKLKKEYENLKKLILDENIQLELKLKIDNLTSQLEIIKKKSYEGNKNIQVPYNYNGCVITWIDDDGKQGFLTNLKPLLDKYNYKCNLAVITKNIGNSGYLSKDELLSLQNEGFEICSHSNAHVESIYKNDLSNVSYATIENDLKASFDYLFENGFNGYDKLVYPWGNFGNQRIKFKQVARKFFKYAVNAFGSYNISPCDNMYLDRYFVYKAKSYEDIKKVIDEAVANKGWLILGSHSYSNNEFDITLFNQVLSYISSLKIPVLTLEEAIKYKGNALSIGEKEDTIGDKIYIANDGKNNLARKIYPVSTKFTESSVITDFQENCKTSFISDNNNSFGVAGTIDTFRSSAKYYSYQTFTPYNKCETYMRKWDDKNNKWLAWTQYITTESVNNYIPLIVNKGSYKGTMDDNITSYTQYKETISQIVNTSDTLTSVGGVLKTYRGNTNYSFQVFYNINGNVYYRRWNGKDDNGRWTTWKQVNYV